MQYIFIIAGLILFIFLVAGLLRANFRIKKESNSSLSDNQILLLKKHVPFLNTLNDTKQEEFKNRMQHFIASTRITGVNTEVEHLDKILIAASAIIPIFGFKNWEYMNLNEVLLYPDSFNEDFQQQGEDRNTLGVVGTGPYQNIMILSRHNLREGFLSATGNSNTAVHEFVHLIDKTDGETDGVPESMIDKAYTLPWLNLIHQNIEAIQQNNSDINPYGATNKAEFFAVVSEYFFTQPDLLKERHSELYEMLSKIFRQKL
ncbi:MAG: M90 family metallopeptidase [Ginsengibacter sp.]